MHGPLVVPEAALLGRPVVALVTREGDQTVLRHLVHLQAVGLGRLVASEGHVTFEMYAEQSEESFPSNAGQMLLQSSESTSPDGQASKGFSRTLEDCTVSQVFLYRCIPCWSSGRG